MRLAILLTATVRPQVRGANFTEAQRMEMYTSTLQYYAEKVGLRYPIVVVENSGADLSAWGTKFRGTLQLETIQFPHGGGMAEDETGDSEPFVPGKGKGYNEFLMIRKACGLSETLRGSTHFMKITGRYPMLNIREMADEAVRRGSGKVFMGDVKDTRLYELLHVARTGHWGTRGFLLRTRPTTGSFCVAATAGWTMACPAAMPRTGCCGSRGNTERTGVSASASAIRCSSAEVAAQQDTGRTMPH